MTELVLVLRFFVIALIYAILFRLIGIMIFELKNPKKSSPESEEFAIQVVNPGKNEKLAVGTVFPIRDHLTIGRKNGNMLKLSDIYVSGNHAVLFLYEGNLYLRDLGSKNGTECNRKRIEEDTLLDVEDEIRIGKLVLKVI